MSDSISQPTKQERRKHGHIRHASASSSISQTSTLESIHGIDSTSTNSSSATTSKRNSLINIANPFNWISSHHGNSNNNNNNNTLSTSTSTTAPRSQSPGSTLNQHIQNPPPGSPPQSTSNLGSQSPNSASSTSHSYGIGIGNGNTAIGVSKWSPTQITTYLTTHGFSTQTASLISHMSGNDLLNASHEDLWRLGVSAGDCARVLGAVKKLQAGYLARGVAASSSGSGSISVGGGVGVGNADGNGGGLNEKRHQRKLSGGIGGEGIGSVVFGGMVGGNADKDGTDKSGNSNSLKRGLRKIMSMDVLGGRNGAIAANANVNNGNNSNSSNSFSSIGSGRTAAEFSQSFQSQQQPIPGMQQSVPASTSTSTSTSSSPTTPPSPQKVLRGVRSQDFIKTVGLGLGSANGSNAVGNDVVGGLAQPHHAYHQQENVAEIRSAIPVPVEQVSAGVPLPVGGLSSTNTSRSITRSPSPSNANANGNPNQPVSQYTHTQTTSLSVPLPGMIPTASSFSGSSAASASLLLLHPRGSVDSFHTSVETMNSVEAVVGTSSSSSTSFSTVVPAESVNVRSASLPRGMRSGSRGGGHSHSSSMSNLLEVVGDGGGNINGNGLCLSSSSVGSLAASGKVPSLSSHSAGSSSGNGVASASMGTPVAAAVGGLAIVTNTNGNLYRPDRVGGASSGGGGGSSGGDYLPVSAAPPGALPPPAITNSGEVPIAPSTVVEPVRTSSNSNLRAMAMAMSASSSSSSSSSTTSPSESHYQYHHGVRSASPIAISTSMAVGLANSGVAVTSPTSERTTSLRRPVYQYQQLQQQQQQPSSPTTATTTAAATMTIIKTQNLNVNDDVRGATTTNGRSPLNISFPSPNSLNVPGNGVYSQGPPISPRGTSPASGSGSGNAVTFDLPIMNNHKNSSTSSGSSGSSSSGASSAAVAAAVAAASVPGPDGLPVIRPRTSSMGNVVTSLSSASASVLGGLAVSPSSLMAMTFPGGVGEDSFAGRSSSAGSNGSRINSVSNSSSSGHNMHLHHQRSMHLFGPPAVRSLSGGASGVGLVVAPVRGASNSSLSGGGVDVGVGVGKEDEVGGGEVGGKMSLDQCVKVYHEKEYRILGVSSCDDGAVLRDSIMEEFGIPSERRKLYGLFGLGPDGNVDMVNPLSDSALLAIKSADFRIRSHLVLDLTPEAQHMETLEFTKGLLFDESSRLSSAVMNGSSSPLVAQEASFSGVSTAEAYLQHQQLDRLDSKSSVNLIQQQHHQQQQSQQTQIPARGMSTSVTVTGNATGTGIGVGAAAPVFYTSPRKHKGPRPANLMMPSHAGGNKSGRLPGALRGNNVGGGAAGANGEIVVAGRTTSHLASTLSRGGVYRVATAPFKLGAAGAGNAGHGHVSAGGGGVRWADEVSNGGAGVGQDIYFGERPPSEVICENLGLFFPALASGRSSSAPSSQQPQQQQQQQQQHQQKDGSETASSDTVASVKESDGTAGPVAENSGGWDNDGNDSAEDVDGLKRMIRESVMVKRLSKLGRQHTSFGRRSSIAAKPVSSIEEEDHADGVSIGGDKNDVIAGTSGPSEPTGSRSIAAMVPTVGMPGVPAPRTTSLRKSAVPRPVSAVTEEWRDRIAGLGSSGGLFVSAENPELTREQVVAARRRSVKRLSSALQHPMAPIEGPGARRVSSLYGAPGLHHLYDSSASQGGKESSRVNRHRATVHGRGSDEPLSPLDEEERRSSEEQQLIDKFATSPGRSPRSRRYTKDEYREEIKKIILDEGEDESWFVKPVDKMGDDGGEVKKDVEGDGKREVDGDEGGAITSRSFSWKGFAPVPVPESPTSAVTRAKTVPWVEVLKRVDSRHGGKRGSKLDGRWEDKSDRADGEGDDDGKQMVHQDSGVHDLNGADGDGKWGVVEEGCVSVGDKARRSVSVVSFKDKVETVEVEMESGTETETETETEGDTTANEEDEGEAYTPSFTPDGETPTHIVWKKGQLIGKGSFGRVYFGVNLTTKELMAVKQVEMIPVRKGSAADTGKMRQKMVDARDNTISVFLQYVDGGSIASMLSKYGPFDEELVRSFSCQILSGLAYLHERCIIHRDIKGANILVNKDGVAKISDFGISKKNEYKMAYRYNSRMSLQGSVYWMAPEVIKSKGYSAKVDIWSLGCVTLEMLTGNHPWRQLDEMQTMWRLGKENAPPVPEVGLSEGAREFLGQCFVIEPDERPTAVELLEIPFANVDPAEFPFSEWLAEVERLRLARELAEAEEDDDDDDEDDSDAESDEDESTFDTAENTSRRSG
ncbi:hypothetical protein HDU76_000609, partial [Blyttiomyces sp. JEL0837]